MIKEYLEGNGSITNEKPENCADLLSSKQEVP